MSTVCTNPSLQDRYDVIVLGAALSGASTATLLKRWNPELRVLIIERSEDLGRRVGEATVEVSAYFLCRVLGLTQYLNEQHISKQGLRFWFANDEVKQLDQASEIGPKYQVRIPSFQLDRSTLDEEILQRTIDTGVALLRPAQVRNVELNPGGLQKVEIKYQDQTHHLEARWVVDATGLTSLLARKNGWWHRNTSHPTAALWSRWKGVKDWDGVELAQKYPKWSKSVYCIRGTATNHLIGEGWWAWMIPLKGGDVSIGIVFDQRILKWEESTDKLGDRLKNFLLQHPVGKELMEDSEYDPTDVHWRRNLAYYSDTFAGDGFTLVGDAAAFMDPFYSPGMDWISFTCSSAAHLITQQYKGADMPPLIEKYNQDFKASHERWFSSLYKDKYYYMGEWDLLDLAFRMDLSLYYWGVVEPVYHQGMDALIMPPFSPPSGKFFSKLMSCYNRRFAAIARRRKRLGLLGRSNAHRQKLIPGFTLERKDMFRLFGMLWSWLKLELKEGIKCTPEDRMSPAFEAPKTRSTPVEPSASA